MTPVIPVSYTHLPCSNLTVNQKKVNYIIVLNFIVLELNKSLLSFEPLKELAFIVISRYSLVRKNETVGTRLPELSLIHI